MVDRDDMLDGGARHVADTVRAIKRRRAEVLVEALVGDFNGVLRDVATVVTAGRPDVFAHNLETVERLQRTVRDVRCGFDRSLAVLAHATRLDPEIYTKSSLMVGLGEEPAEVRAAMRALRDVGVDVLTLGQYLRPSPRHHEVVRYVHPDEFAALHDEGLAMGFRYVASGPLVRSSYRAAEAFLRGLVRRHDLDAVRARADALAGAGGEPGRAPPRRMLPVVS
jgi:lipoic acid synthetase